MSIGDLIVLSASNMVYAYSRRTGSQCVPNAGDIAQALDAANALVRAVYGPPCGRMSLKERRPGAGDFIGPFVSVPSPHGRPGDSCCECGWPRSFHQEVAA